MMTGDGREIVTRAFHGPGVGPTEATGDALPAWLVDAIGVTEASHRLRCSARLVGLMAEKGMIRRFKVGGRFAYHAGDVEAMAQARQNLPLAWRRGS